MTPLTAVLSKPWTFSSLVIVWQLQTRTIVTLRAAPCFTLCKNKVCKTDKRPLSLTIYFLWRYRMYNFPFKQIIFTDYMKCKHQPHSKWKPLCFTQENRYPFVKHGHFMINFAVSWLRLCQCLNVLEILSKWYKPICIGGLNHS